MDRYDAVVVGAGPNGLSAAVTLARAGRSVLVVEAAEEIGGGTRTEESTIPGFRHDICSAIHPFAAGSPFLRTLPLETHGLRWAYPEIPVAHALTPDEVATLPGDLDEARDVMGPWYADTMGAIADDWHRLESHLLGPLLRRPRAPLALARFGAVGTLPASVAWRRLPTERARALFASVAAHAFLPLTRPFTASFAWLLMAGAHLFGWPAAQGGSQALAEALAGHLRDLGGRIETGWTVQNLGELPPRDLTLLDVSPEVFARLANDRLPASYLRRVARYRRGPAAFKVDYALDGPMPWTHPDLIRAGTVHLGGTARDIAAAEQAAWEGRPNPRPFLLVAQQSTFDATRAPDGKHTLWVYAHVPHASAADHTADIEDQLETFAPGFRDLVLARNVTSPADFEERNPNLVGGDIAGGAHTLRQLVFRPFPQLDPYSTPLDGVFLCGASTPPGAGTHGMCGHNAAKAALGEGPPA